METTEKLTDSNILNKLLELQRQYDDVIITEDDLSLEEMDEVHQLYLTQIKDLRKKLAKKMDVVGVIILKILSIKK